MYDPITHSDAGAPASTDSATIETGDLDAEAAASDPSSESGFECAGVTDPALAEAASTETATESTSADEPEEKERRARGSLEADVKTVTDAFVSGEIKLGEGEHLTPHRIGRLLVEREGLEKAPSTGAIAAVLDRWVKYGYAAVGEKPTAFVDYTDDARNVGLAELKARHRAATSATRKAAKSAEAGASTTEAETATVAEDATGTADASAEASEPVGPVVFNPGETPDDPNALVGV